MILYKSNASGRIDLSKAKSVAANAAGISIGFANMPAGKSATTTVHHGN